VAEELIAYSHNPAFVLASLAIVMMAGFTGLSLTRGASKLPTVQRKLVVSMSSVAMGAGIWSMHFVAMLGLQMPVQFYYDGLVTLISALLAILITGSAFLVLHFLPRTPRTIALAGGIIGLGIPTMHFIGMSGIELCAPVYSAAGVALSFAASVALSVVAMRVAYSERGRRNILLGTAMFGIAVFSVHFLAMSGTDFTLLPDRTTAGPAINNQTLGIIVTLSAFVISGAFLLTGITFFPVQAEASGLEAVAPVLVETASALVTSSGAQSRPAQDAEAMPPQAPAPRNANLSVPYEREGRTYFLEAAAIAALRAEGHYTILYHGNEQLFSPWSISEAESRLTPIGFLRVHRSYLVNPTHVTGFERLKDGGQCFFAKTPAVPPVPVSRTRLPDLRRALGI
jgi:NO-binding membrane sensor protein with MHYT domain